MPVGTKRKRDDSPAGEGPRESELLYHCLRCDTTKPASKFHIGCTTVTCRDCSNQRIADRQRQKKARLALNLSKHCKGCEKELPECEFRMLMREFDTSDEFFNAICVGCEKGGQVRCCKTCMFVGAPSEFSATNVCKPCLNAIDMTKATTLEGFMEKMCHNCRTTASVRAGKGRKEAGECAISKAFLLELWARQAGKCAYSGLEMTHLPGSDWKCSVERKDNDRGYVEDNVTLVCAEFNGFKQFSKAKIERIIRESKRDTTLDSDEWVRNLLNPPALARQPRIRPMRITVHGIYWISCRYCDRMVHASMFHQGAVTGGCKPCSLRRKQAYISTATGHLRTLYTRSKHSSAARDGRVTVDKRENEHNITFEDLKQMLLSQKGRCAYTGIPMRFGCAKEQNWVCSLERLDPLKGYSRGNIALIVAELNTADHSAHMKREATGSAGWSEAKVAYLVANARL